jgi:hypothetical protein
MYSRNCPFGFAERELVSKGIHFPSSKLGWAFCPRSRRAIAVAILTAKSITFKDDTKKIRKQVQQSSLSKCFKPEAWKDLNFFALVEPDNDVLPVRTVYDGITQNIGNNYLTSKTPLWFAGPDLIASAIRTGKPLRILRAIRIVPHGKQAGMKTVKLRGSMVEINPYKDDLFRKVIEQRKLNKADKKLYLAEDPRQFDLRILR